MNYRSLAFSTAPNTSTFTICDESSENIEQKRAKVLCDYEAKDSSELTLKASEVSVI